MSERGRGREGGIASERQNMAGPCVRGSEPPSARPTAPEALGRSGTLWDLRHSFCAAAASRPHDGVSHRCINARAGLLAHPAGHASPPAAPAEDPILQAKRACPVPRRQAAWSVEKCWFCKQIRPPFPKCRVWPAPRRPMPPQWRLRLGPGSPRSGGGGSSSRALAAVR